MLIYLEDYFDNYVVKKRIVNNLRINTQSSKKQKKLLSPKATSIYASMLEKNNFKMPEGVEGTTEKEIQSYLASKEELQSYLDLLSVDDVRMNLSSIMKTNIIDDLNTLATFLKDPYHKEYNGLDKENRLNIADEIQKMADELTKNKFLSDNISQLGDNLNRIRMIKQAVIDKLMNLNLLQVLCMLTKLLEAELLLEKKVDPFLFQIIEIMKYLK